MPSGGNEKARVQEAAADEEGVEAAIRKLIPVGGRGESAVLVVAVVERCDE